MTPKLSIIVPIYNVEAYLRKCVDSVLNQDYEDYEIILVDDGSTDACPQICEEYAANNAHIRVIHQPNAGLSAARNTGSRASRGEYIMFVDSDDYIEPNVLGVLMAQVERDNLDVLRFDYRNVRIVDAMHSEYETFQPYKNPHEVDKRHDVVDGVTYLNERMGYSCYAWQFIFRRDLIVSTPNTIRYTPENGNCLFTEGIHFEDVDWLPRMMLKAKRVGSTQTVVYNYFWREGSITLTQGDKAKIRKNLDDQVSIIAKYSELRKQHPACTWLRNMQSNMVAGVLTTVAREFYRERNAYVKKLREWDVFPLAIADQGRTYERRAWIINLFGPRLYCALMRLRGKIGFENVK